MSIHNDPAPAISVPLRPCFDIIHRRRSRCRPNDVPYYLEKCPLNLLSSNRRSFASPFPPPPRAECISIHMGQAVSRPETAAGSFTASSTASRCVYWPKPLEEDISLTFPAPCPLPCPQLTLTKPPPPRLSPSLLPAPTPPSRSPTARCPPTRPSAEVMMLSTPSSPRPEPATRPPCRLRRP